MSSPSPLTETALDYARANRRAFMDGFQQLLRIPTVSTEPVHEGDVQRCAEWLVAEMDGLGFDGCRTIETEGHPVVYGEWLRAGADKPTVLVYAHYDVQPVDPLAAWETPPFEPAVRDGKLYARGSIDDKVGVWANLKAIESILAAQGTLPVNVKLIFEGEEEIASPHMPAFVRDHKELLDADYLVLCDGFFDPQRPTITYALRGIVAAEVTVRGPDHDLHSGKYGGTVHNPLHVVGKMVGSFHDDAGRVQIPGFYDDVRRLSAEESKRMHETWQEVQANVKREAGVGHFWAQELGSFPQRQTALPSLDVNGMWGGYQGPGVKTIIPGGAGFKVTVRLVPDQDPREIAQKLGSYVMDFAGDTVDVATEIKATSWPVTMDVQGPLLEAVQRALQATTGKRALLLRGGGSIPIGGMFQQELAIPMSNLALGSGDNVHAPNEFIYVDDFYLGIDTLIHFYHEVAQTT